MELLAFVVCWLIAMLAYCLHLQYQANPRNLTGWKKVLYTICDTFIGAPCEARKDPALAAAFATIMALPFLSIAVLLYVNWILGLIMLTLLVTAWVWVRGYIKKMSKKGL